MCSDDAVIALALENRELTSTEIAIRLKTTVAHALQACRRAEISLPPAKRGPKPKKSISPMNDRIGSALLRWRTETNDLSRAEVAELFATTATRIRCLEQGTVDVGVNEASRVAALIGMTLVELLTLRPDQVAYPVGKAA